MKNGKERRRAEFEAMFRVLWPRAHRVAYRILGQVAEAEDAAAEAFARAYVSWRRVGSLDHREAWVLRVTSNVAVDMARRKARRPGGRAQETEAFEDAVADRVTLGTALASLPRRQREIVALRYLAGFGEEDVARSLGIARSTVKEHARRARTSLRELLGSKDGREDDEAVDR